MPFEDIFPFRLHSILEEAESNDLTHIISWLPCGTKFVIHDKEAFTKTFVTKYFRHSNFKSFLRQISMYKFQRDKPGPGGAYFHPHFVKNNVQLCALMSRVQQRAHCPHKKKPSSSTTTWIVRFLSLAMLDTS